VRDGSLCGGPANEVFLPLFADYMEFFHARLWVEMAVNASLSRSSVVFEG